MSLVLQPSSASGLAGRAESAAARSKLQVQRRLVLVPICKGAIEIAGLWEWFSFFFSTSTIVTIFSTNISLWVSVSDLLKQRAIWVEKFDPVLAFHYFDKIPTISNLKAKRFILVQRFQCTACWFCYFWTCGDVEHHCRSAQQSKNVHLLGTGKWKKQERVMVSIAPSKVHSQGSNSLPTQQPKVSPLPTGCL